MGRGRTVVKIWMRRENGNIFTFYTFIQGFSNLFVLLQNNVISFILKAHSRQLGELMQIIMFSCCVERFVLIVSQLTGDRASF